MKTVYAALASVLLVGAVSADEPQPSLAKNPTALRVGDRVKIEFTADRQTDVAVYIEDAGGKIIRHLAAGVPVFDIREKFGTTDIVISTAAKGAALAQVLADKPVALLRAHGMVAVGPTLPVAVFRAVFTVTNANIQHQAIALGGPLAALDAEEGRVADVVNVQTVDRSWDLWKRRVA